MQDNSVLNRGRGRVEWALPYFSGRSGCVSYKKDRVESRRLATMERPPDQQDVTRLLQEWRGGNKDALDQLMPVVYDHLRKLAARSLYSERREHTLRATELVNEVYVKLVQLFVSGRV